MQEYRTYVLSLVCSCWCVGSSPALFINNNNEIEMIRPLGKTMLIKKIEEETVGSLIVARSKNAPFKATLLAMGKECTTDAQIGDTLLVAPFGVVQFDQSDEDHLLVTERELLGVVV